MPIKKPGKRPFAPWLEETHAFKKAGRKQREAIDLLLTPLIDMFVILVVFLIMSFSAAGEFPTSSEIALPISRATALLERAPIVEVSARTVAIEGFKVADSAETLRDGDLRIPALTEKLGEMRQVDELMHPGQAFKGRIVINADKAIDFRLIRKVMAASAEAGYTAINYAVLVHP